MSTDTPLLDGAAPLSSSSPLTKSRGTLPKSISSCILAEGASEAKSAEYKSTQRKLIIALFFAFAFMIVEVVGGIYAHSLAIITDAAHLLSDVSGFAVSVFAAFYAAKRSKEHFSYGYHRIEVLGALASILTVWLVTGVLVFEAVNRIIKPEPVNGKIMFILAMIGVGVNIALVFILGHDHSHGGHGHSHGHDHSHSHGHSCGGHSHPPALARAGSSGVSRSPLLDTVPESPQREHAHSHAAHAEEHFDHSHSHGSDVEEGHAHGHAHGANCSHGHGHNHSHERLAVAAAGAGAGAEEDHSGHGCGAAAAAAAGGAGSGHSHDTRNINLRGAVVHVIGDLVQSIGVAVAGALIWYHQDDPRWYLADPICTFFFAILVMWTTRAILRDISDVLMERSPRGLCIKTINDEIGRIHGVEEIHDLHVWSLTPGIPLLCAHINMSVEADASEVLHSITNYCRNKGIEHSTVQLVVNGRVCPCVTVPADLEDAPHGHSHHNHGHSH